MSEKEIEIMNLHLEKEQLDALRKIKEENGLTIQWQIRRAIEVYLASEKK